MNQKTILLIIGIVALIVATIFLLKGSITGESINKETIQIPLNSIKTEATFYEYEGVRYFLVLGDDGEPRVALDACDVCGGKKGYRQEGKFMVCNNCGQRFDINKLGDSNRAGGGCWPSHLDFKIKNEFIEINPQDLTKNKWRF